MDIATTTPARSRWLVPLSLSVFVFWGPLQRPPVQSRTIVLGKPDA